MAAGDHRGYHTIKPADGREKGGEGHAGAVHGRVCTFDEKQGFALPRQEKRYTIKREKFGEGEQIP